MIFIIYIKYYTFISLDSINVMKFLPVVARLGPDPGILCFL